MHSMAAQGPKKGDGQSGSLSSQKREPVPFSSRITDLLHRYLISSLAVGLGPFDDLLTLPRAGEADILVASPRDVNTF